MLIYLYYLSRPRRNPAPTLATGRKSKTVELPPDEYQKREMRRSRNRKAAEKCKEKRTQIENLLQDRKDFLSREHKDLQLEISTLTSLKEQYLKLFKEHANCQQQPQQQMRAQQPQQSSWQQPNGTTTTTTYHQAFGNQTYYSGTSQQQSTTTNSSSFQSQSTTTPTPTSFNQYNHHHQQQYQHQHQSNSNMYQMSSNRY